MYGTLRIWKSFVLLQMVFFFIKMWIKTNVIDKLTVFIWANIFFQCTQIHRQNKFHETCTIKKIMATLSKIATEVIERNFFLRSLSLSLSKRQPIFGPTCDELLFIQTFEKKKNTVVVVAVCCGRKRKIIYF